MRQLLTRLGGLLLILGAIDGSLTAQQLCGGVERWAVKVGSDQAASTISLASPVPTLLHDLIQLPRPTLPSNDTTRHAQETTVRVVDGRLVKFKRESGRTGDQDYHLIISDDTLIFSPGGGGTQPLPHSFVAEIVDPACVPGRNGTAGTTSMFQAQLQAVFDKFHQQFSNITGGWNDSEGIPVRVTGIGFFDRPHGQTGRAMNGLEIHPVLDIEFNPGSAPTPPPAPMGAVALNNPGFETGSGGWSTTPDVISTNNIEPARTGAAKAWLGGYGVPHTDTLSQQVALPGTAQAINLRFFLHISTEEQALQVFDTMRVRIRSSSGAVLATLRTYSNLQAQPGYQLQTFNLTGFRGQTIRVELIAQEDNGSMTSFVVDDFEIVVE